MRVLPTGKVQVVTGATPHGQGHETSWSMIVADKLGVDPRRRRGAALRHRHQPARARHLRLALAGRRRHRHRTWPLDKVIDKARAHRRPPAGGGRGRPRVRRRRVPRAGHARQGDAAGRRSPSRRSPPTTCPTAWSRTSRPRSPTTRPTSRGPFGTHICVVEVDEETGDGRRAGVRRRRRLRQPDQPAHRRGPGARRRRPGPRPGAVRGGRLRRRRQPPDAHAGRLPGARRRRRARRSPPTTPSPRRPPTRSGSRASARPAPSAPHPAVINAIVDALSHLGVTDVAMPASPAAGVAGHPSRLEQGGAA